MANGVIALSYSPGWLDFSDFSLYLASLRGPFFVVLSCDNQNTSQRQGVGKTAAILRQFCVWNNRPTVAGPWLLCFEDAALRFEPEHGGRLQIKSAAPNN